MTFYAFAHQYLLWFALLFLPAALFLRFLFFIRLIIKSRPRVNPGNSKLIYIVLILSRSLLPLNSIILEKPLYSSLRLLFHVALIALPLWLPMHIFTFSYSSLGWTWTPFPLAISEMLTIAVIFFCALFFLRRMLLAKVRKNSTSWDFLFLLAIMAPYVTGYLSAHDPFSGRSQFLASNMYTLHVITGEIMILMIGFLFVKIYVNQDECIACAACSENCPTQTLAYRDLVTERSFYYSHYQCIVCATCVNVCPVGAVSLKHVLSLRKFIQFKPRLPIMTYPLVKCDICSNYIASVGQINRIKGDIDFESLKLCERCRRLQSAFLLE